MDTAGKGGIVNVTTWSPPGSRWASATTASGEPTPRSCRTASGWRIDRTHCRRPGFIGTSSDRIRVTGTILVARVHQLVPADEARTALRRGSAPSESRPQSKRAPASSGSPCFVSSRRGRGLRLAEAAAAWHPWTRTGQSTARADLDETPELWPSCRRPARVMLERTSTEAGAVVLSCRATLEVVRPASRSPNCSSRALTER